MRKYLLFLFLIVVVVGCSRERRPEGFPKLYPCSILITEEGVPVVGVMVSLVHPDLTARWAVGAESDESGVATIRTHGFAGAPQGRYKIVLSKTITEGRGRVGDDHKMLGWEDIKVWALIDPKYEKAEDSPLEIEVRKNTRETFEIGKAEPRLIEVIKRGMP